MTDEMKVPSGNGGQDWKEHRRLVLSELKHGRETDERLEDRMRNLEQAMTRMEGTIATGFSDIRGEVKDQALKRNAHASIAGAVTSVVVLISKWLLGQGQ